MTDSAFVIRQKPKGEGRSIYMTPDEWADAEKKADAWGVTLSHFLREVVRNTPYPEDEGAQ